MDVYGDRDEKWKEPIHRLKLSPPCHSIHSIEWRLFPVEDCFTVENI
jgi:hypothetical protein